MNPESGSGKATGLCPHGNFLSSCTTCASERKERAEGHFELDANKEFLGFQKVEVTKVDETKPWKPALEVKVTKADGSLAEGLDANTPFFTFKSLEGGTDLTVSAAAAGHIDSLHIKGEEAGSRFEYPSLEGLFADVQKKLPEKVAKEPGVTAFDMEMGKSMGKEGIASMDELKADGRIADGDISAAQGEREKVAALNMKGSKEEKDAFIAAFKQAHPDGKVQFQLVRGDVLVPVVDAPKRDTSKLFMVFGPDAKGGKTMYTAAPGRYMPRHPNPGQHKDAAGVLNEATFKESADAWFDTVMLTGK